MYRALAHHPHNMAAGLASLGRGGDSMLVHMTPHEVAGLQKLAMAHGGSLTINPHTGLYEAGFLSSLLPMIAGIGLNFLLPGIGAVGAGLLTGGATGLVTGDWKKGLMAGLGAFGGAGIGNALSNIGASTVADSIPITGAPPLAGTAASTTAEIPASISSDTASAASDALTSQAQAAINAPIDVSQITAPVINNSGEVIGQTGMLGSAPGATASAGQNLTSGLKALAQHPIDTSKAIYSNLGESAGIGGSKLANAAVAASAAAPVMNQMMQQPTLNGVSASNPNYYYVPASGYKSLYSPGTVNPNIAKLGYLPAGQSAFTGQQFNPGVLTNTTPYPVVNPAPGYASGGQIPVAPQNQAAADYYSSLLAAPSKSSILPTPPPPDAMNAYLQKYTDMVTPKTVPSQDQSSSQASSQPATSSQIPSSFTDPSTGQVYNLPHYTFNPATGTFTQTDTDNNPYADRGQNKAQGGEIEGTYAAGGKLLRGPGDGMSDSIPAVIHGQKPQRAALADGEFVIPADVVSHLGNGSTEAGSRKLYQMMDKIRQARTGNPKQGKQINPDKFLPR